MKYTQKELEAMSDFDIDRICATHRGVNPDSAPNYCGRWCDCGVLDDYLRAIAGATIEFDGSISLFHHRKNKISVRCKGTKRASSIAYILVKQSNE